MGCEYSSVVDAPRDEVFAWHARPGAFNRLSPPWSPLRVVTEADSLEGRARHAGAARWAALGRRPPAGLLRSAAAFRRRHRQRRAGLAAGTNRGAVAAHPRIRRGRRRSRTRVIDRVDTPVPAVGCCGPCSPTGTGNWPTIWPRTGWRPSTVWLRRPSRSPGSSGLVGSALTAFLSTGGHRVIQLVRQHRARRRRAAVEPGRPRPATARRRRRGDSLGRRLDRRALHRRAPKRDPRQPDWPDPPAGRTGGTRPPTGRPC